MRRILLIAAIFTTYMLQVSNPAHGQGNPVTLVACWSFESANSLVEIIVKTTAILPGKLEQMGCNLVSPFVPTDIDSQTIVIGPLNDAEGDLFAVHEIPLDSGSTVWAFTWYPKGVSPIGLPV